MVKLLPPTHTPIEYSCHNSKKINLFTTAYLGILPVWLFLLVASLVFLFPSVTLNIGGWHEFPAVVAGGMAAEVEGPVAVKVFVGYLAVSVVVVVLG